MANFIVQGFGYKLKSVVLNHKYGSRPVGLKDSVAFSWAAAPRGVVNEVLVF